MLTIYYATDTGNAEIAAHALAAQLRARHEVAVHDLGSRTPQDLASADGLSVFLCATCDEGQVPEHARDTYDALARGGWDLTGVRFAAFGLGDSVYRDTYNDGCRRLVEALLLNGAELVADPCFHDASDGSDPVDAVEEWYASAAERLVVAGR